MCSDMSSEKNSLKYCALLLNVISEYWRFLIPCQGFTTKVNRMIFNVHYAPEYCMFPYADESFVLLKPHLFYSLQHKKHALKKQ